MRYEQRDEDRKVLKPGYAFLPVDQETIIDFVNTNQILQGLGRRSLRMDLMKMGNPELYDYLERGGDEYLAGAVLCYSILETQQLKLSEQDYMPRIDGNFLRTYEKNETHIEELRKKEPESCCLFDFFLKEGVGINNQDIFLRGALDVYDIFKKTQKVRNAKLN